MKKKNIILLFLSIIIIIGLYIGYKVFILYYYNINNSTTENYSEYVKGLKIKDKIVIKHDKTSTNYLEFNGVKIRNDFEKFTKLDGTQNTTDSVKYMLYDENKNLMASFWISIGNSYTNLLKNDSTIFGTNDKRLTNADLTKILEKNNINNDIDLFKYLVNYTPKSKSIFTNKSIIKEDFDTQYMTLLALPNVDYITEISGDYSGYMFNLHNDIKEVSILKNNKRYIFTFLKTSYFTDDYIQELLNTIVIK